VCNEWKKDYEAFHAWSMANGYQDNLTIDRQDNDFGYNPENCRWTTMLVQANNKSNNIPIEAFGETKNLAQWARDTRCVVGSQTIQNRIAGGLQPEIAISKPPRSK
jgi:hypothetical protein